MRKRGRILIENVLSLIVAVIGLVLLFYGAYKLYEVTVNQENEVAKNVLNVIEGKIENLDEGESGKFLVRGVKGWFLTAWSKDDKDRPEKCFFGSCVCICPPESRADIKSCEKKGYCRILKADYIYLYGFIQEKGKEMIVKPEDVVKDIRNPEYYKPKYWAKGGIYSYILLSRRCPDFSENNLFEVYVNKKNDVLAILLVTEEEIGSVYGAACNRDEYVSR